MENINQAGQHKIILIGITLTSLICILSISFPVVGFFCFLILPLPALYYRIKIGRRKGALVIFSSFAFLLFFTGGGSADIFFIAGMLMLGFFMGEFINQDLPIEKLIAYSCCTVLSVGTFGLIIYGNISNLGLVQLVSGYIGKNLEMTLILYKNMGVPEESIKILAESMEQIKYLLLRILPAIFSAGLMFSAWLNLLILKIILKDQSDKYTALGKFNIWKAPEYLVWGVIGFSFMLLLPVSFLKILGFNGIIIFLTIYFFQGIAVISFYFEKKKTPVVLRAMVYGIILIQQLLVLAIAGLGFFDIWLNFRKIGNNNNDSEIPLSS